MSKSLTGTATAKVSAQFQNTTGLNTVFSGSPSLQSNVKYATTDVSKVWFSNYTVGTTPTSVDLTTTVDSFGAAQVFAKVLAFQVVNNDATHTVTVGGSTGNDLFAALPVIAPGGSVFFATSLTVDSTHKVIELTASAAGTSVDLIVLGN